MLEAVHMKLNACLDRFERFGIKAPGRHYIKSAAENGKYVLANLDVVLIYLYHTQKKLRCR